MNKLIEYTFARDLIQGGSRAGGSGVWIVKDGVLCGGLMSWTIKENVSKGCVYMYLISIFFSGSGHDYHIPIQ